MTKRRENVSHTPTTKVVKVRKPKVTPSVSEREMPKQTADFNAFLRVVAVEDFDAQFPTYATYTDFRFELPMKRSLDAELTLTPKEYEAGWNGISDILSVLWEKYLGDKFQSQMLANFVFSLLLGGVEKGWTAVLNYVKAHLGEEAANDTGAVVDGLNELFANGGYDKVVTGIKQTRDELNAPVAYTGAKPKFWQRVLRGFKLALMLLSKK